ncbi:MAG: hypothetical protein QM744_09370 [Mesorhizobium sp.]
MTDPRLPEPVEKTERGYRHVQDRIKKLRRSGRLPYGWITDATRRGYHTPTYRDEADFLRSMKGYYRADLWQQSDFYCEVWTESRSIAGVVEADCHELAVSLYPAGGFSSITLAYQSAETINHYAAGILRNLLRTNIESLLPEHALAVARVEEESARDYFEKLAEISGGLHE